MTTTPEPPATAPTVPRTVRITDEQWKAIADYARRNHTTVSLLVRDHFAGLLRRDATARGRATP